MCNRLLGRIRNGLKVVVAAALLLIGHPATRADRSPIAANAVVETVIGELEQPRTREVIIEQIESTIVVPHMSHQKHNYAVCQRSGERVPLARHVVRPRYIDRRARSNGRRVTMAR